MVQTVTLVVACLLSAIQMVSNQFGKTSEARNAVVHTQVHIGKPKDMDGFGLEVEIQVEGVDKELIDAGHAVGVVGLSTMIIQLTGISSRLAHTAVL